MHDKATFVIKRRYINFGALSMNFLEVSKSLAAYVDPSKIDGYERQIDGIGIVMQILTFGLFLSFGAVALKKLVVKAQAANLGDVRSKFSSFFSRSSQEPVEAATIEAGRKGGLSIELSTMQSGGTGVLANPMSTQRPLPDGWTEEVSKEEGKLYYHNTVSGTTTWTRPSAS